MSRSCTQEYHDYLKEDPERFHQETIPGGIQEDDVERLEYGHCKRCKSTLALVTEVKPTMNPEHPIEVIPEDMDAASFVYDTLAQFDVTTARFKAGPAETLGIMVALTKRAEQQGFDVVAKPARGMTKVFVSRKRERLNASPTRCPKCGKSKYFCECGSPRSNPPSWVRDEAVWERATARVKPYWKKYKEPYAVITDLYMRMGGRRK